MITVFTACLLACGFADQQAAARMPSQRAHVTTERPSAATPSGLGLQGYSVVLVVGDMQGTTGSETVPSAARKALTDMQAFLPYKRYQLLDAAWMVCCGVYRSPITGRLRGPDEREYAYAIETLSGENGKLTVRFSLREGDVVSGQSSAAARAGAMPQTAMSDAARAEYSRQLYEVRKERDNAEIQLKRVQQQHSVGTATSSEVDSATLHYQTARARVEEIERMLSARNALPPVGTRGSVLDSTFAIAIGETVVIGTSRLNGDRALITLLTAAGKPGAAR